MPTLKFKLRDQTEQKIENAPKDAKLLAVAIRSGVDLRYGCSAGKCGTCAVRIIDGDPNTMEREERELLEKMGVFNEDKIRLACRIRVPEKDLVMDLTFQDEYDPAELGF